MPSYGLLALSSMKGLASLMLALALRQRFRYLFTVCGLARD